MYERHFHCQERPFLAAPRTDRYVATASCEAARTTLTRCLQRAEGPALLIGPAGTGKSLLLHLLASQLRPELEVALLSSTRLNAPRALLQAVMYELGLPYRGIDEGELRLSLLDHLAHQENQQQGLVLLVDEAHLLPLSVLLEVRVLTNLVRRGAAQVRVVLAGAASLEERFAHPRLDSFNQRLAARCYLAAMDRGETEQFVRSQLSSAGGDPGLFDDEAMTRVFSATDGVPRLVNQLCDHALMLAFAEGQQRIDAGLIDAAWADLQQLPAPWNHGPRQPSSEARGEIIEIGELDDEEDCPNILEIGADRSGAADRRLDALDVHLAALQDDYQPVGGAVPEIEFTPKTPAEMFKEPFEEEEVVLDRYSQWDAVRSASRRVNSLGDDASLAALLRSIERPPVHHGVVRQEAAAVATATMTADLPAPQSPATVVVPLPAAKEPRRPAKYSNLFSKLRTP